MEEILRVEHLTKNYVKKNGAVFSAVEDVSFFQEQGEILGVIGKSGSGKSTIANMITHLIPISEGRVFFQGEEITHYNSRQLKTLYQSIQMVFQNPTESFDPRRTLGDGIGESLKNAGLKRCDVKEEVMRLLMRCGLTREFYIKYPYEVSGGECQRAAIARAIAIHPKLLICDEATSALDVTIQHDIVELLRSLNQSMDLSILFISHDLPLVSSFCHRIMVIDHGRIVEEGLVNEVIHQPSSKYTKQLIESVF